MARPQCGAVTTHLRCQRLRLLQPTWPAHRGGPRDPRRDHAPRALSPDAATRDVAADRGRSRQTVTPKPVSPSHTSDSRSETNAFAASRLRVASICERERVTVAIARFVHVFGSPGLSHRYPEELLVLEQGIDDVRRRVPVNEKP